MTSAAQLKFIRNTHRYLGLFFAPVILFFAITAGLQMFGLHEGARGSSYTPPQILVHLAQLHKKGTLYLPSRKGGPPGAPRPDGAKVDAPKPPANPAPAAPPPPSPLPIKIFFAATAITLVLSTCSGIIIGWKYARRKSSVLFMLAAGILLPILLLFL